MKPAAVEIDHLTVDRGAVRAVDDVTLALPAGRIVGLLGPSGSGKTTLMRAIVGVQRIASGDVRVLGRPAGAADVRRRVGYMTQAASVYRDLSARENLRFFARVSDAAPDRVDAVLETVDLAGHADRPVGALSGGQSTRVSLAAALIADPDVLVLDEPTVGLDPVLRRDLWAMFRRLADEAGKTLVVSSHVMDEAVHCDVLVLLREGRVLAFDEPAALVDRTGAADVERAFLALVDAERERSAA
jgi:ABC-2 type transport system ATP-binding protein